MQVGLNLPVMVPGLDRARILEWSRRIDRGPFSSLAAGERITFPNPEILVTLSAAAAVTERVKIALTVMVLPLHATALVAKQIATLDVVSGGRVVLGVGAGARREDYAAAEAEYEIAKLARLEEQVGLLRRMWAGENLVPGRRAAGRAVPGAARRSADPRGLAVREVDPARGALGRRARGLQLRTVARRDRRRVRSRAQGVERARPPRTAARHELLVRARAGRPRAARRVPAPLPELHGRDRSRRTCCRSSPRLRRTRCATRCARCAISAPTR